MYQSLYSEKSAADDALSGWKKMLQKAVHPKNGDIVLSSVEERLKSLDAAWTRFDKAHYKLVLTHRYLRISLFLITFLGYKNVLRKFFHFLRFLILVPLFQHPLVSFYNQSCCYIPASPWALLLLSDIENNYFAVCSAPSCNGIEI